MTTEQALAAVLSDLLEMIDAADIRFDADDEHGETDAIWDYTLIRARQLVRKVQPAGIPTLTRAAP